MPIPTETSRPRTGKTAEEKVREPNYRWGKDEGEKKDLKIDAELTSATSSSKSRREKAG